MTGIQEVQAVHRQPSVPLNKDFWTHWGVGCRVECSWQTRWQCRIDSGSKVRVPVHQNLNLFSHALPSNHYVFGFLLMPTIFTLGGRQTCSRRPSSPCRRSSKPVMGWRLRYLTCPSLVWMNKWKLRYLSQVGTSPNNIICMWKLNVIFWI